MHRREFIASLSRAMAMASAATVSASASTRGKYGHSTRSVDVEQALGKVDEVNRCIDNDELFDAPSQQIASRGYDARLFRDSIKAMLVIGTFGDFNEKDRAHPLMQQRMRDSVDLFDRTILGMATYLESTPREERRKIRRLLRDNPDMGRGFQAAFDTHGRGLRVPYQRLDHFHTLWNRSTRALKRPTCSTVIDEYIDKVDREALRCGITPETRRELALHWDSELVDRLALEAADLHEPTHVAAAGQRGSYGQVSERVRRRRLGLRLLGVAGGVTAAGGLLCLIGGASGAEGLFFAAMGLGTVAVVLLIIALSVAVSASLADDSPPEALRARDPSYQSRLRQAIEWVREQSTGDTEKLQKLTAEASLKFDVMFNDIWTRLE